MLQNLEWTKATVNGKKAAFVVFNNNMWLLSYCRDWDRPDDFGYADVPKHSFFKAMIIEEHIQDIYHSWQDWRAGHLYRELSPENIKFPGEPGYERGVRRTRRSNETSEPQVEVVFEEVIDEELTDNNDGSIDFYLRNYTTANIYQGLNGYHNSHQRGFMNQPRNDYRGHRIGIELEIEANSRVLQTEICDKTSNWFTRESDGSLGQYGIEFITIPLLPDDAKSYGTWMPLCTYLKNKAKSWDTGRCGLHVHIGREILGDTENEKQLALGKLLIFYQSEIESWDKGISVFGRARCYNQPDGDTEEIKAVKCLGKEVLKDPTVLDKVDRAMKRKFTGNRYFAVNLTNNATIEFREGKGSINADRIIAVVTLTESICLFCRETEAHELTIDKFINWLYNHVDCGNPLYRYLGITQQDR